MPSHVRPRALFTLLCVTWALGAAALGVAAPGCGSSVAVDSTTEPAPAGGSDAGADADPTDPTDPTDPPPKPEKDGGPKDSGPKDPPLGSGCAEGTTALSPGDPPGWGECKCESSPGIVLNGDCGPLTLTAPYSNPNSFLQCESSLAYAWGFQCSWNSTKVDISACMAKDTAPCVHIHRNEDWDGNVTLTGELIDGAGVAWTFGDITLDGDLPWMGPTVNGVFTAKGTRSDGETIQIDGSFDLCVGIASACPN